MMSEHDRYVALEVQHNVIALDADSVYSWANATEEGASREDRISRLREGVVLLMWKLDSAEYDPLERYEIDGKREELQFTIDMERLKAGIEDEAREKVRKVWTHSP